MDGIALAHSASLVTVIAARYAASLFDVALEAKALAAVETGLAQFDALLRESPDLMRLVRSPVFSADDQGRAVGAILAKAEIGGLVANLVRLMARNRRLFAMPEMFGEFRKLLATHRGEASADVTLARTLSDGQMNDLKAALNQIAGKDVTIHANIDPAILGGMIVKMGSRQIDTSIRTKLSSLKLALKEVG
jgi:F-type H+-transporting ATPase subunit delta